MVQRYDLDRYNPDGAEMEVFAAGGYVLYSDYEKLKRYADALASEVAKFEAGERAFLDHALFAYRNIND